MFLLLYLALGSFSDAGVILGTLPVAFAGGILALLLAGETWNVSSLVGIGRVKGISSGSDPLFLTVRPEPSSGTTDKRFLHSDCHMQAGKQS